MLKIPLTSLQDVLAITDESYFEQILAELPGLLRSMRERTMIDGHAGFSWPIMWRPDGGLSTITSHFPGGETFKHHLNHDAKTTGLDYSLVAKWLAFTAPQVHEAFLNEFKR